MKPKMRINTFRASSFTLIELLVVPARFRGDSAESIKV